MRRIAIGRNSADCLVLNSRCRVWDSHQLCQIHELRGHTGSVKCIARDIRAHSIIATGSRDGSVAFWDLRCASGPLLQTRQWPKSHRRRNGRCQPSYSLTCLVGDPRRNLFWSGSATGQVQTWDQRMLRESVTEVGEEINGDVMDTQPRGICAIDLSSCGSKLMIARVNGIIEVFSTTHAESPKLCNFFGHTSSFYTKALFSPDGSHILSGSQDSAAYIWSLSSPGEPISILRGHAIEVAAVDWSHSDVGLVATGCDEGCTRIWSPQNAPISAPVSAERTLEDTQFGRVRKGTDLRKLERLKQQRLSFGMPFEATHAECQDTA